MKKLTPAQQQYRDLKQQHKDALLFFRLGDFYELFYEDAKIAHRELDITLTSKNKHAPNPIPMAGVPHHSAEKYIQKLVNAGYKVAIAEQVGPVVPGKVVERAITHVVTPGTDLDEERGFKYIVAVYHGGKGAEPYHIAWGDMSLGMWYTKSFPNLEDCLKEILRIAPRELVVDIDFPERDAVEQYVHDVLQLPLSINDVPHDIENYLLHLLGTTSLAGYGKALESGRRSAIGLLFSYIEYMQKKSIQHVGQISFLAPGSFIKLDDITIRNLEIFQSSYEGSVAHSLFGVVNTTRTAMGGRLLHDRLARPVQQLSILHKRLQHIGYFVAHAQERDEVLEVLQGVSDLPRLVTRILYRSPSPVLVQQLMTTLVRLLLDHRSSEVLRDALVRLGLEQVSLDELSNLVQQLQKAITHDQIVHDSGYICDGYDSEVDKYRQIAFHSDELLLTYQQALSAHTSGVKVKVKYVKNQGYCLEVTPKDVETFVATSVVGDEKFDFIRRQTLKTGQRYTTPYLQEIEEKILSAKDDLRQKEQEILGELIGLIADKVDICNSFFSFLAEVDLAASFAQLTLEQGWVCPELHEGYETRIVQGRHPVVEVYLDKSAQFIPNDASWDKEQFFHLITGPNMGGKSTFLRQNALIVLLAHAGLYVPAKSANIALVDGIFARVGSGDALAKNQSTFMTEMLEMANILHNATAQSFVVLDELGRGTSTYDGMALAKAIVVYMCQKLGAKALFATHYHELTGLPAQLAGAENFSVSVYETDNEVVFLKKVVRGRASKSYGLDVAKLAGVPHDILQQAKLYLAELEQHGARPVQTGFSFARESTQQGSQDPVMQKIKELLQTCNLDDMTPMEALLLLQDVQQKLIE